MPAELRPVSKHSLISSRPPLTRAAVFSSMEEIPRAELNELALTRGDATTLAQYGDAPAGFERLNRGLERALQLPEDTPWRTALVGRWREACELFAEIHGIRLG